MTTRNGEEALHHLRTGPTPDLILLDMLMPVLDGWHFLGRLRQEGPQRLPVRLTDAADLQLRRA